MKTRSLRALAMSWSVCAPRENARIWPRGFRPTTRFTSFAGKGSSIFNNVTLKGIKKACSFPEVNDEFASQIRDGFTSSTNLLRTILKEDMTSEKKSGSPQRVKARPDH